MLAQALPQTTKTYKVDLFQNGDWVDETKIEATSPRDADTQMIALGKTRLDFDSWGNPRLQKSKIITHPGAAQAPESFRYMVKLFTKAVDYWGVPDNDTVIDVVALEATEAAVTELVKAAGWLKSWTIASIWQPEDCDEF